MSQLLIELRHFKNSLEHNQTCLRLKHSTQVCKQNIADIASRHNDISLVENECFFARINKSLFRILVNLSASDQKRSKRVLNLIEKLGICTCIELEKLVELQNINSSGVYYYDEQLSSIILDYLYLTLRNSKSNSGLNLPTETKRKSIFFPLLIDESLVPKENKQETYNADLFKKFHEIISQLNEKSLLVCKYLTSSLKNYAKYLEPNDTICGQCLQYKWMICEIFYLYKDILKLILDDQNKEFGCKIRIFEIICKYLIDFLVLTSSSNYLLDSETTSLNSPTTPNSAKEPKQSAGVRSSVSHFNINNSNEMTNSQHEFEKSINKKFLDFLSKNSIKIYENISELCALFELSPYLSILICSQLILFKNELSDLSLFLTNEQYLSKCLIDTIDRSNQLLANYSIINILLELYIKCARFRNALNECQHFHLNLLNCLNVAFGLKMDEHDQIDAQRIENLSDQALKYIELLLDLLFSYFYFNKKVS